MKVKELEILTKNLEKQKEFYAEVLGLKTLAESAQKVSFPIGTSVLTLKESADFLPYHFAINIPSNQEKDALEWLEKRVEVIKDGDSKIQYFDFWDAYAVYFYDADQNIVEFIARRTLNQNSDKKFNRDSLLSISEIGLPTYDIAQEFKVLNDETGIPIYSGSMERFCAVGDENGLFIVINKALKKEWFPTQMEPMSAPFHIKFLENGNLHGFDYENKQLKPTEKASSNGSV